VAEQEEPGQATIYIHRDSSFASFFNKSDILWDGKKIYKLPEETSLFFSCQPGEHTVQSEHKKEVLTFEALEGRDYHIQIKTGLTGYYPVMVTDRNKIAQFKEFEDIRLDLQAVLSAPETPGWQKMMGKALYFIFCLVLMMIAYFIFHLLQSYCDYHFGDSSGLMMVIIVIAAVAVVAILGYIPYAYTHKWIPEGLRVVHAAFVLLSALLISLIIAVSMQDEFLKTVLISFPLVAVAAFYLSLGSIAALNRYYPEAIHLVVQSGIWKSIGIVVSVIFAIAMNIYLFIVLGKTRDLSGAYETSDKAYWATQDGNHFMSAKKWQTGEWRAPLSAGMRYLLVNAVIVALLFISSIHLQLSSLLIYFIYLGLTFLSCVLLSIVAR
jgi:hypothetical protein